MKNIVKKLCITTIFLTSVIFEAHAVGVNQAAPDFTLKSYSGKNLKLSEYRGQVVLLNFWASWCGPCRQEMPLLEKTHKKYKKLGFTVMGVNVEENNNKAKGIVKKNKLTFPVLFDTQSKVSKLYQVSAMPSTVIIDRSGKMRYFHKGYKPGDEKTYVKWVKKLIREM
ncbi:MAG: TlpA family protein disulfide reductase [Gammaproteobacteria bacterium]